MTYCGLLQVLCVLLSITILVVCIAWQSVPQNLVTEPFVSQASLRRPDVEAYVLYLGSEQQMQFFDDAYNFELACDVVPAVDDAGAIAQSDITDDKSPYFDQIVRYLTHCQVWSYLSTTESDALKYVVVFEDAAVVGDNYSWQTIANDLAKLPDTWHMYLLEAEKSGPGKVHDIKKCRAYVINRAGTDWLWQHGNLLPVHADLESTLSALTHKGLQIHQGHIAGYQGM